MSRIGKQPVVIPDKVQVTVKGDHIEVKGPLGTETMVLDPFVTIKVQEKEILIERREDSPNARARHGLSRKLIANMVHGVSHGFEKNLDIVGVGYRADVQGKEIVLTLGYSHPIHFPIPEGVKIKIDKQTKVTITGASKDLVGNTAARIRFLRKPEPYKGKGVKYIDEVIIRKAGKSAVGGGAPGAGGK